VIVAKEVHDVSADFRSVFQRDSEYVATAPGRVNLMGDHTDYNGGFVLPTIIPQRTQAEIALRSDRTVRVWSAEVEPAEALRTYELGQESRDGTWSDYVESATYVLSGSQTLTGFDLRVSSSVPLGAGLSSSASLLVCMLRVLREALALTLTDLEIAHLSHRAEAEFVGVPVGIMDQMACSLGTAGYALSIDTRSLQYEHIALPPDADWIVIHSGVHHSHATGGYRRRRQECEEASRMLGVPDLRGLQGEGRQTLLARLESLPEPLGRRACHVVTENERVLRGVELLETGDIQKFGELMYRSHDSLRRDYEVSTAEIDLLVDLARSETQVYGARLTGGGFGGSVVMAAPAGTARAIAPRISAEYQARSGRVPVILVPVNVQQNVNPSGKVTS
jgi:galactokinase